MDYTVWLIAAIALIVLEFAMPGFVVVFFGFAALVVAFLTWIGLISSSGVQLTIFAVLSVASLVTLRRTFQRWFTGTSQDENVAQDERLIGQEVVIVDDFVNGRGKVELNGVKWHAKASKKLKAGQSARIVSRDSTQLVVE
ncbi:MAG: membrane protein [Lysobacteraceae bacterium]|nr:MAG: membrane protein [Xanthomonadaceae bacterium]